MSVNSSKSMYMLIQLQILTRRVAQGGIVRRCNRKGFCKICCRGVGVVQKAPGGGVVRTPAPRPFQGVCETLLLEGHHRPCDSYDHQENASSAPLGQTGTCHSGQGF